MDFARLGFTRQVRLAREVSDSTPPLGVYICEVPHPSGATVTGSITLMEQGMKVANKSEIVPYWQASEASETLSGLNNGNRRYIYVYV